MSFRLRVTLLATVAVAVAAVAAAILMYFVVQTQLLSQFDNNLVEAANGVRDPRGGGPGGRFPGGPQGSVSGRSDVAAQILNSNTGTVARSDAQPVVSLVTPEAVAVASGTKSAYFFDTTLEGSHLRVYVAPAAQRGTAIEVWGPLNPIDNALAETRIRLALVAFGGVLLAAALGTLVARAALSPVKRLTNIVEEVARTRDLSRRVSAHSTDELGRLAASFNMMLGELETSLRSQRQLVADASHELRTPLTSLRTNLELLERGHPTDPAERQQVLGELVGQMERLSTLVSDLIDLARDEQTQLVIEDVELEDVANDAIAEMGLRYPQVRFQLEGGPSTVRGVRSRILRAVTNLLDNAGKWSPPQAVVEVTVRASEITVRDHGPGISPEDEARVFDRFWRADAARQLPGSGLGLAIVKEVAETHGGRVTLERPVGGGAFFRLRLGNIASS
ncbi:MAG: HAMP domain-containing sensor histidine kinase [Candidatus Limnocylindria bacterium]|nr:HAMP domain-containing sensor histidine kinase [Candidatus Limnocylindria bacterium]